MAPVPLDAKMKQSLPVLKTAFRSRDIFLKISRLYRLFNFLGLLQLHRSC